MIGKRKYSKSVEQDETDELAFNAWASTGSLMKASYQFRMEGILKRDGRPYTHMGIRYCAMRYMTKNFLAAKQFIMDSFRINGIVPVEQDVDRTLIGYACEVLKKRQWVEAWLIKHNLYPGNESFIKEKIELMEKRNINRGNYKKS